MLKVPWAYSELLSLVLPMDFLSSQLIGWDILAALLSFSETNWEFSWLCIGSLSSWNVHPHFIFIILVDRSRVLSGTFCLVHTMSRYIFPFILLLIIWILPVLNHDLLGSCTLPFDLQTWCVLWRPKSTIFVSSDQTILTVVHRLV